MSNLTEAVTGDVFCALIGDDIGYGASIERDRFTHVAGQDSFTLHARCEDFVVKVDVADGNSSDVIPLLISSMSSYESGAKFSEDDVLSEPDTTEVRIADNNNVYRLTVSAISSQVQP